MAGWDDAISGNGNVRIGSIGDRRKMMNLCSESHHSYRGLKENGKEENVDSKGREENVDKLREEKRKARRHAGRQGMGHK